jgi:hypothetical protein
MILIGVSGWEAAQAVKDVRILTNVVLERRYDDRLWTRGTVHLP